MNPAAAGDLIRHTYGMPLSQKRKVYIAAKRRRVQGQCPCAG